MQQFLEKHKDDIIGVLSGFDRVLFRGTALDIAWDGGLNNRLFELGIRYERFYSFVKNVTERITEHAENMARQLGRPVIHLNSPNQSKEDHARDILARDAVQEGLICVLTCVETCQTFNLRRRGKNNWLTLVPERRKCKFLYFYYLDPEFGFMHVRLQTWLPMTIQVCINGREYLARQLEQAGIGFEKHGNCFTRIDDLPRAQEQLDRLHTRDWPATLSRYARLVNPWCAAGNELNFRGYYWSFRESESATDVMFRDAGTLSRLYPALVRHALDHFQAPEVLRFFSRRLTHRFGNEISTDLRERDEGVRIKHRAEENSIKMYDKAGSVLRIETTVYNPRRFRVYRSCVRNGELTRDWFKLRKGVIDTGRRVEICHAANGRYLDALSVVDEPAPACEVLDPVSRPVVRQGRRYRALRPLSREDAELLSVLQRGEFTVNGFRNRDVYEQLYQNQRHTRQTRRRATGRITRWLRLLRAHGLIRKVSHTFNYRITAKGNRVITLALRLRNIELAQLPA